LGHHPKGDYGFVGVSVMDAPWAPFAVDFKPRQRGRASAGLMFSLAVIDKLTPATLPARGPWRAPARSSRTAKWAGSVGSCTRWARPTIAGATVFLVPAENCYEANSKQVPGLQLVKVDNLGGAVEALHAAPPAETAELLTPGDDARRRAA